MDDPVAIRYPEGKAGDPFTEVHWAAFVQTAQALGIDVASGSGLALANGGIASTRKQWVWLKLTSVSSGAYAWTRVVRDASGWSDTAEAGTTSSDPARAVNTLTLSTFPYYVRARREPSGEYLFIASTC
jgi:hypothetical protein